MKRLPLLSLLLLLCATPSQASDRLLHIGISTGYPPFYFFTEDNRPAGICIDIIDRVTAAMGISVEYKSYPWKRMLQYGKDGSADAIMPLFRTADREQFLIFPQTALIDEDNSLFTAASSPYQYSGQLSDLTERKIAVVDGFSYGPEFDRTEFKNKNLVQTTEQLIQLVQSGRVDFGIGNSKVISYTASQMGLARKLRFLTPPITEAPLFIGFSKQKIDQALVDRFNQQLHKFKSSPDYLQVIRSYSSL